MVHASYCTEEMKQLDFQARTNGVTILNEIGLDPGIDHFLAKKMIDEIQAQEGAKVMELYLIIFLRYTVIVIHLCSLAVHA